MFPSILQAGDKPRYLTLMIALLAVILFETIFDGYRDSGTFYSAVLLAVALFGVVTTIRKEARHRRQILVIGGIVVLLDLALAIGSHVQPWLLFGEAICWAVITGYAAVMILRSLFQTPSVTLNEVFGAVSVYILIGLLWFQFYMVAYFWTRDAFVFNPAIAPEGFLTRGQLLYFSYVTLSTVGYGDITPGIPMTRALAIVEGLLGVLYLATVIARFVGLFFRESSSK